MKIVLDMNLSPGWVPVLKAGGHGCVHWSEVGKATALDREIMMWARSNNFVVFTHDLDFGAILAATNADAPSVLQLRSQNILPQHSGKLVLSILKQFEKVLTEGALVTVDDKRARARILPISRRNEKTPAI